MYKAGVAHPEQATQRIGEAFGQYPHWARSDEPARGVRNALYRTLIEDEGDLRGRERPGAADDAGHAAGQPMNCGYDHGHVVVRALRPPQLPEPLEPTVAQHVFRTDVDAWAERIGVQPKEVLLRPMRRKWPSCPTRGRIAVDLGLLSQSAAFRTHVIAYELLHLKVPNHGNGVQGTLALPPRGGHR